VTADEYAALIEKSGQLKDLKKLYDAQRGARGQLDEVRTISDLRDAGTAVKSVEEVERTPDGRLARPTGQSIGDILVESQQYKDFKGHYAGRDGIIPASSKGLHMQAVQSGVTVKTLITGASSTSAGALTENDRFPTVTDLIGERELTITDVITKGSTDSDVVEYVRVTGKTNAAAPTAEATTAADPAISGASPGPYTVATASGAKPESELVLEVVTTNVKTIAHWIPITKRAASDAGQVRTLVDSFLRYGLFEELEDQILTGAGTGENFTGINGTSGISTVGSAGTDLDAIVDAIRTIRVTGRRRPNAVAIHPNDWYSTNFLLAKDSQNRYLVADPSQSPDAMTLWGLKVVVTEAQTENTALVGDFRQAVLWEREGVTISMTDSHKDFFTRNLLAVLAEMRAAFGVLDPQGFCTVTAV
jgi:HK97 family phage major capsid protein